MTPKDAATLILVDRSTSAPKILMGRRNAAHAFLPGKYVFPGGRLDAGDARMASASELSPETLERLSLRMRRPANPARARALALAAIRETFEETGFILGKPGTHTRPAPQGWKPFAASGHLPHLAGLTFFARAITPPGRTRRFDTRFFLADAAHIANPGSPTLHADGELLESAWATLPEAMA
ncbi:MAG: NUDIX hydrolase, partial [Aestuariivirgaceae bacterium]|nr:NUDIX hydrolase [Aestuariivirgaceae bacterium]